MRKPGVGQARRYSWPPFEPGNQAAAKHGAGSAAIVAVNVPPVIAEVQSAISTSLPFATQADIFHVEALARLLVRIRQIDGYLDRLGGGLIDSRGRPRGCASLYLALLREFRSMAGELGVGPAARARLLGDLSVLQQREHAERASDELRQRYGQREGGPVQATTVGRVEANGA
ncbi:MAG: hypothetical protein M3067_05935 [Chloroflexota bacterium]|nr:hypothetical protein [Chloroflexota bacterium]MDQ6898246.1 hypothetical protein [Candidatus Dormibacteraeota bacterium]